LPKAYLNWVLLDDQFKYVAGNMGAMQVQAGSSKQALVAPLQTIAKNGYLYIYVSNQSPQNVYFDDLIIKHYTGPLLQEQSYYPFGLEMAGISDKAMNKLDSKNKFNGGVELEEDFGVNLYATFYRQYDPQIGRFSGVDILSEKSINVSVYQFALNDPIRMNNPFGSKETATGGGGSADYLSEWNDIYNTLYYGDGGHYGGQWLPPQNASGGGYSFFSSDQEAFMYGSMDMDRNNSWGNDGFATSFKNAQNSYYKNGGTDPGVGYLAPNVYLRGFSNKALENLDAQIERNARMGFGGNNEESNGWETAHTIFEAGSLSYESTIESIKGAQRLANRIGGTSSEILTGGELAEGVGKGLAAAGAGLTIADGIANGWKPHHTADLVVDATIYTISASVPVAGWIVGGVWFFGDIITKEITGKSITENIFDNGE